jgi:hypothetical protein
MATASEPRILLQYHTSMPGRATFVVFLCASLAAVAFVAVPLVLLAMQTGGGIGMGMAVAGLLLGLIGSACAMLCGLRAFGSGLRLTTTNEGFKYEGLFRVARVRWKRIESFSLSEGDFIVRLTVKVRTETRGTQTLKLDVGGLNPPKEEVLRVFSESTGLPLPAPKKGKRKAAKQGDAADDAEKAAA